MLPTDWLKNMSSTRQDSQRWPPGVWTIAAGTPAGHRPMAEQSPGGDHQVTTGWVYDFVQGQENWPATYGSRKIGIQPKSSARTIYVQLGPRLNIASVLCPIPFHVKQNQICLNWSAILQPCYRHHQHNSVLSNPCRHNQLQSFVTSSPRGHNYTLDNSRLSNQILPVSILPPPPLPPMWWSLILAEIRQKLMQNCVVGLYKGPYFCRCFILHVCFTTVAV